MKTQVFDYIGCQEYLIAMDDTNTWQKYWITMYFNMSNWLKLVKWVLSNNEWQNNLIIPQQKNLAKSRAVKGKGLVGCIFLDATL